MRPENPEGKHLADAPSPQHQRYRDLMDSLGDGQAGQAGQVQQGGQQWRSWAAVSTVQYSFKGLTVD